MAASERIAQPAIGAATQLVTGAARLLRIIVQATGTGIANIYDNTASTGTPIFSTPASPPIGTIYELGIPCTTGLRVDVAAAGPQLTVIYNGG